MAQWNADDFAQELASIQNLVALRRPGTNMGQSLVQQLQGRVEQHPAWTAEQLCKMMETAQASSLQESKQFP